MQMQEAIRGVFELASHLHVCQSEFDRWKNQWAKQAGLIC